MVGDHPFDLYVKNLTLLGRMVSIAALGVEDMMADMTKMGSKRISGKVVITVA